MAKTTAAPGPPETEIAWWLRPGTAMVLSGVYGLWAWALLTNFDFRAIAAEKLGRVFPDMARRMLVGDFTISRDAIQFEAFIRDGVTYTYYGIFPGLLRIPLVWLGMDGLDVARISCIVALVLTVFAYILLFQEVLRHTTATGRWLATAALLSLVLSGPQIFVLASASLYHELIFWSAALTALFQWIVMRRWLRGETLRGREYYTLAILAGLCLLCRVPNGAGLYFALLLLLLHSFVPWARAMQAGRRAGGAAARPAWVLTLLGAGCVALSFVAVQGVVNHYRWGNALEASPYAYYTQVLDHPDAAARIARHGLFAWPRVAMAAAYYGTGLKLEQVAPALFEDYYGGIEGPRAVVPATAPLLFVLAVVGVGGMLRRPVAHAPAAFLAIGGALCVVLMLGFMALCLRYAFDGWGLLVLLAAVGLRALDGVRPRLVGLAAVALLAAGIAGSHLMLLRYKIVYSGTDPRVRYELSRRLQPLICSRAPLAVGVKLTDFNPLVTPNCPPLW